MKKFVAIIMMAIALMSTFGAQATDLVELRHFCEGFDVNVIEEHDGSGVMYIQVNDMDDHVIELYTEDVNSDTVVMSVYRNGSGEEVLSGTVLSKDNYEVAMMDVIEKLFEREAVNQDYAAGRISEEYRDEMLFKYRIANR